MQLCSKIIWRLVCFIVILGLSIFFLLKLYNITRETEKSVAQETCCIRNRSLSRIEAVRKLLVPLNSSALNLARSLSSSLNGTELSFFNIRVMVAPVLFLTLATIPYTSQASYVGLDGIVYSVYNEKYRTLAMFSNTSYSKDWYIQPVNRDTGQLYGQAVVTSAIETVNSTWFKEAFNRTNGYCWLGAGWNKHQSNNYLFYSAVAMDGRGIISLGLAMRDVVQHFEALDFHDGDFHLATTDGLVIVRTKLPNIEMLVQNNTISVQRRNPHGGLASHVGVVSCLNDRQGQPEPFQIKGIKYTFSCSSLDVAGVKSVYVLAYPSKGLPHIVYENRQILLRFLLLLFLLIFISICGFCFLIMKAARREIVLCAALVKQMDATQQAERKSMNKTTAFNRAHHDIRNALVAISALVGLCHDDSRHKSELSYNLSKIKTGINDLFGILNSVLDTSKIEAGKIQLEEEEFDLAQLLEDVVDMYYHVAITKGVDVVLDPCDNSITKFCRVKGDRGKLKQILCNLLGNAVKFTSEGHITVRAVVKDTSFENAIIASNRNVLLKCLPRWCWFMNKEGGKDLDALHTAQQDPNIRQFEFEVDDTGKGIPKDMQKAVFENFFQVTDSTLGQEGCGLGLGIIQSLVRLMGGDISIMDKEAGERGTCFNFNVKLPICDPQAGEAGGDGYRSSPPNGFQHFGLLRGPVAKPDGSHVVLLLAGEERRKVLTRYIENFGIKVSSVKKGKSLLLHLDKIKRKLDISYFNHERSPTQIGPNPMETLIGASASLNADSGPINVITEGGPSCTKDGVGLDHSSPPYKKNNSKGSPGILLIVIDANVDGLPELCSFVTNFKKDLDVTRCVVVWLEYPTEADTEAERKLTPPFDHALSKPFHGSRLYQVLGLLPELKKCNLPKLSMGSKTAQEIEVALDLPGTNMFHLDFLDQDPFDHGPVCSSLDQLAQPSEGPLSGKKVMLVEDVKFLRVLTTKILAKNGAKVEGCANGKEAFDKICKALSEQVKEEESNGNALPFDYIFMDCEMPVMDGYEATRLIRLEEQKYGVHIPIIALTADSMPEEVSKTMEAGMDFHLDKPLQVGKFLEIIPSWHSNIA